MSERKIIDAYFCPACGAELGDDLNSSCSICGKIPREGYFPLDNLRASYRGNLQPVATAPEPLVLFEENKNKASETARAFAVYALVPYLGILFCPGAVLMGGIGIFNAKRHPELGGYRISRFSIVAGVLILFAQIFLWWLLYIIPTLKR